MFYFIYVFLSINSSKKYLKKQIEEKRYKRKKHVMVIKPRDLSIQKQSIIRSDQIPLDQLKLNVIGYLSDILRECYK